MSDRLDKLRVKATTTSNPKRRRFYLDEIKKEKVRHDIVVCTRCPLAQTRTQAVPFDAGKIPATIAIVGEGPGAREDRDGRPFVGRAGQRLLRYLQAADISRSDTFICNVVSCRPPGNREPRESEVEACSDHFEKQLRLSRAWVVVLLGGSALKRILSDVKEIKISDYAGRPFWKNGRVWFPTYHPAYALRNPRQINPVITTHIKQAVDIAQGTTDFPRFDLNNVVNTTRDPEKIWDRFRKYGWVLIYSRVLRDQLLVVRDYRVDIPAALLELPTYTPDELVRLGELTDHPSPGRTVLEAVHLLKSEFGSDIGVW